MGNLALFHFWPVCGWDPQSHLILSSSQGLLTLGELLGKEMLFSGKCQAPSQISGQGIRMALALSVPQRHGGCLRKGEAGEEGESLHLWIDCRELQPCVSDFAGSPTFLISQVVNADG